MNTDYLLMFIDYLFIPFLATGIDLKRAQGDTVMSFATFLRYVSYTVAIAVITYILRLVASRLGLSINMDPGTGLYTCMAVVVALIIPYIREIAATYINVRCEIKGKK